MYVDDMDNKINFTKHIHIHHYITEIYMVQKCSISELK